VHYNDKQWRRCENPTVRCFPKTRLESTWEATAGFSGGFASGRVTFSVTALGHQLHSLAYNLGNFLRTLATPGPIKDWSLTNLKEKLIKIGAKIVSHGRYVVFQMAEVVIPRNLFTDILRLIAELRPPPVTSTA